MFDKLTPTHYAAIGVAAVALIGFALWPSSAPDTETAPTEVATTGTGTASTSTLPRTASAPTGGIDPMSTQFNPALLFDIGYAGGLQIDAETQSKLDQILSNLPPEPTQADMDKLEKSLREGLPREDAEKAVKLIKGYRSYVGDVKQTLETSGIPTSRSAVDAMFRSMETSQARNFDGSTAKALFGEEMRIGRLVMEAALVDQDPNLSYDDKKQRLDALRAQLPEAKRNSIVEPTKPEGAASEPARQ